jgi:RHS repeat-associated protein
VPVYAFDGSTYTNYNGTTNATGQVTLTLPLGNYRFRADKNGTQYWSGPSNHCTVPGCTSVTVTLTTGGASNGGRALAQTRLPANDPGLLLLAPLAMLALAGRKGKRQRWATLAAAMLLVVAVMGTGTMLAGDDSSPVALAAPSDLTGLRDLSGLPAMVKSFAPPMSTVVAHPAASQVLTTTTTVIRYTYDPLQRLTSATYSDGKSFQHEYDAVGNRTISTQTITSTLVMSYTYDVANRLTSVNGQAYTWDANGNLKNDSSKTYLYNQANQLVTVTASGLTWSASYNGDGARLKQTVNGAETAYTLDLAAPLVTVLAQHAARSTQYIYGQGDSPLAGYDGTLSGVERWTYFSGRDGLNSVRQETDASGNVIAVRSFDPYGVSLQGGGGSPFGYTGEVWDNYTKLLYLRARWYNPATGRFTQADPYQLENNFYLYAGASPITFSDPMGACTYRTGDPEDTCRVESTDTNLYRIALAHPQVFNSRDWKKIEAYNPERLCKFTLNSKEIETYCIHPGDLIWLRERTATQPVQGSSPLDVISGYLEGRMKSSTIACLTYWVDGDEIVYDFARIPPERAHFRYVGVGISLSTLPSGGDVTLTDYAGFIWGFDPSKDADIFKDYSGPTLSGSAGVTVNPLDFLNFGGGVGGFKSLTSQVFGFVGYTSAGINAGTPGVGLTLSILGTYYMGDSLRKYDNPPASGLYSAISTGESSPLKDNPPGDNSLINGRRSRAADQVYSVLTRYYGYAPPH